MRIPSSSQVEAWSESSPRCKGSADHARVEMILQLARGGEWAASNQNSRFKEEEEGILALESGENG